MSPQGRWRPSVWFDMPGEVLLRPRRLDRRRDHLSGHHVEVADQALRPVTLVLELATFDLTRLLGFDLTRLHGLGRRDPFERLDAGHLIDAHGVDPVLGQLRSRLIARANDLDLRPKGVGVVRLGVEPIPAQMRLQVGLILKNARLVGLRSTRRSRV